MSPQEAVAELEEMNSQFVHGPRPLDQIIQALKPIVRKTCAEEGCGALAPLFMGPDNFNYCGVHLPRGGQPIPEA